MSLKRLRSILQLWWEPLSKQLINIIPRWSQISVAIPFPAEGCTLNFLGVLFLVFSIALILFFYQVHKNKPKFRPQ
jgi:hypothetical protein